MRQKALDETEVSAGRCCSYSGHSQGEGGGGLDSREHESVHVNHRLKRLVLTMRRKTTLIQERHEFESLPLL